jgi:hypothetical protein
MNLFRESQRPDSRKTRTRPPRYPEGFSEFAKWRYETPELDSHRFGLTVCDIDQVFFHDEEGTKEAYIMLLEVKSHGKTEMEVHAKNIYNLCDSVFRLVSNKTVSVELWGRVEQRKIRYMGWHLLILSNTRPDNSEWMLWDNKHYINKDQLVKILRFELSPYTLESAETLVASPVTIVLKASELERLRVKWKQVIEQAPEDTKRTPIIAILRSAGTKPVAIEGDTVVLAFRYPIHKEKVEMTENRQVAERIITHFLGHSCQVRCIYEPEDDHLLKAALKMGAQIIDVERKSEATLNKG